MAQLNFDARNVDPAQAPQMLPVSDGNGHAVVIVGSQVQPTKGNDGGFLKFDLKIIDGPFVGMGGAWRLNLYNQNQQAVEIAQRQLSAVCHVTGQYVIQDTQQLHNIPFRVLVRLQKKAKAEDPDYTEVYACKDINGNEPGQSGNAGGMPTNQPQGMPGNASQNMPPQNQNSWPSGAPNQPPVNQGMPQPQQPGTGQNPPWGGAPQQQQQPQGTGQPQAGQNWQPNTTAPGNNPPWGNR